ncbi:cytochrome c, class I [Candidatus Koribacter versatilis Ellin345]|uniref:Cytochrome c, class I n=1 Tax=Koribacter versatilis (strain Ellin345) TaxID=204669 RepID=Q1II08_KORVE|nr:cytochrome c [Candidatus Koribacter versatilis]ABF43492.1 cytochrome c, class I [Candidatus Koribacter versatilis Ellin345]
MNSPRAGEKFLFGVVVLTMALMFAFAACDKPERLRSNAELGLNPQQIRGREIYDLRCAGCHEPYRKKDLNGPTMVGVFKKPFLPSGMKASEERVSDVIMYGKPKMPGFSAVLSQQQLQDVLAYMHTL